MLTCVSFSHYEPRFSVYMPLYEKRYILGLTCVMMVKREMERKKVCVENPTCALCSLIVPIVGTDRVFCFRMNKILEHVRNQGPLRGLVVVD